jgi:DNA-binding XRE family transcriptional regulator
VNPVKKYLKREQSNYAQIAKTLGVSRQTVLMWAQDKMRPTRHYKKLSQLLNISIGELSEYFERVKK